MIRDSKRIDHGNPSDLSNEATMTMVRDVADPLPKKGFACRALILLRNCLVIGLALALIVAVVIAPSMDFSCRKFVCRFDLFFFIGALIVIFGSAFLMGRRESKHKKGCVGPAKEAADGEGSSRTKKGKNEDRAFKHFVLIGTAILVVLQAFILIGGRFVTGWDVWYLMGPDDPEVAFYFSRYPNQLFLHGIFAGVSNLLGVFVKSNHYLALSCMSIASVTFCVVMVAYIAKRIAGMRVGAIAFVMAALMCGLSPWIMVPYSDTFGMLFTVSILWAYVCLAPPKIANAEGAKGREQRRRIARWAIIGFATVMGYYIKPTVIFIFVAIICVEVCIACARAHAHRKTEKSRNAKAKASVSKDGQRPIRNVLVRSIVPCLIGFVLAYGCVSVVKSSTYDVQEQAAFSPMHFLMLGSNGATGGVYADADVLYSASFETIEDRNRANLKEYLFRVNSRTWEQNVEFVVRKACTNFADGSFAWEVEGDFYQVIVGTNPAVLGFYGIDSLDWATASPFEYVAQFFWILALAAAFLIVLGSRPSKAEVAMSFALLMLGVFLMIFEARARYLFLYLPYLIVLAAVGWNRLRERFAGRRCS